MTPPEYLAHLKNILQHTGDPLRAQGQMRYMRHQFEYYGLKAPEWQAIGKAVFAQKGVFAGEDLKTFARLAFGDEYREVNYLGIQMVERVIKKQPEDFIVFLEELIITKSWWDTVDWLAKLVGIHFQRYAHLISPVTGNFWLQRVCLIFQLRYKEQTDFDLLCGYILQLIQSKEFFIQKGAGWALRQYSKYNAAAVAGFIEAHPQLPALTKREGLKWLKNKAYL
ncbi:MAG: DNA alkylation repair protein [Saprospiraceae bacterium]